MGKRSDYPRIERDFYRTPAAAVVPLLRHLRPGTRFVEPCAGDGALIDHLTAAGHQCVRAWDIEPRREGIEQTDAMQVEHSGAGVMFITNPPWTRTILHDLITHLSAQHPAWLLFDADWVHTRQAVPFLPLLRKIVAVGRVKWIEGSRFTGKDNCAWHLFDAHHDTPAVFVGRAA